VGRSRRRVFDILEIAADPTPGRDPVHVDVEIAERASTPVVDDNLREGNR